METIVEVDLNDKILTVVKKPRGLSRSLSDRDGSMETACRYDVVVDGVVKHPDCTADSALAALGHYIHSFSYKLSTANDAAIQDYPGRGES